MNHKKSGIKDFYINKEDFLRIRYSLAHNAHEWSKGEIYKETMGRHLIIGVVHSISRDVVTLTRWSITPYDSTPTATEEKEDDEFRAYMDDRY